jgi:ribonuclease BN (tRNA processing enzyme)
MLPEIGVIFDAGTGMFRVRDLIQTPTLDIFLSHIHLDHCVGLTFLYDVLHEKPMQRVTVHVEHDKLDAIRSHLFAKELFPVGPNFDLQPIAADDVIKLPDGSQLTAFPLEHPGSSLGFRVDWPDCSLAYVTDTTAEANADYIENIRNVGTLIHECYFLDGQEELAAKTGHSCLTPVAKVAAKANVQKAYLVHINPLSTDPLPLNHVAAIFSDMQIASDGEVVELETSK